MTRSDGSIRSFLIAAVAAAVVGLGVAAGLEAVRAQGHTHAPASTEAGGWYKRLGPDARAAAIERQLRGFETTMAEVAYRYTEMYFGGVDGNWGYAEHMAHELGNAIALGLERRPQYRKSAETLFLKGPYPQVVEAIKAKNLNLFKQRVEALRAACTACHTAEAHPYIKIGVPTVRRNPVVASD
ncbi:MAG TPA: hypothetical protein VLK28_11230 [Methylomirabilota bacterium]|nr:hypothetical protein [Methylomirabilota bacterium]